MLFGVVQAKVIHYSDDVHNGNDDDDDDNRPTQQEEKQKQKTWNAHIEWLMSMAAA